MGIRDGSGTGGNRDCGPDKEKLGVMWRDESERYVKGCERIANNERYGLRKISCQVNNKNVRLGRNRV